MAPLFAGTVVRRQPLFSEFADVSGSTLQSLSLSNDFPLLKPIAKRLIFVRSADGTRIAAAGTGSAVTEGQRHANTAHPVVEHRPFDSGNGRGAEVAQQRNRQIWRSSHFEGGCG
ncbi:MAG: hypothetical protein HY067_18150 [Betaproteobacteria bacterium]|nr:hypothetical protein [Betaproteobacteria bacterium]